MRDISYIYYRLVGYYGVFFFSVILVSEVGRREIFRKIEYFFLNNR